MRMGFGFGLNKCRDNLLGVEALQAALFSNSEQGFLYDLYDQSTLFQDAAGTTPWATLGQPLGLQLDKSKGLVLGPEQVVNGTFTASGTGWTHPDTAPSVTTFTGGVATMVAAPGGALARLRQSLTLPAGTYEVSVRVVSVSGTPGAALAVGNASSGDATYANFSLYSAGVYTRKVTITGPTLGLAFTAANAAGGTIVIDDVSVKLLPGNHRYQTTPSARPTIEARVNRFVGSETLATQNVTTVAGGYILRFTGAGTVTLSGTATGAYSAGTHSITCTAGTLTATVAGTVTQADLRLSLDSAYPYQRVTTATDYADIGAPRRIKYDGIDDFLQTASVDFSATDKMTVWAGVRKLSDAAPSVLLELSATAATNNGSFVVFAPRAAGNYGCSMRGTAIAGLVVSTYTAPVSNVISLKLDIGATGYLAEIVPRVNGAAPTVANIDGTDAGTGNYGTYPLYFGARAGTSYRFSGEVFSPEVIRGAASTAAQIDMVERVINRNMGGVY
jgi:hypothetical protein